MKFIIGVSTLGVAVIQHHHRDDRVLRRLRDAGRPGVDAVIEVLPDSLQLNPGHPTFAEKALGKITQAGIDG